MVVPSRREQLSRMNLLLKYSYEWAYDRQDRFVCAVCAWPLRVWRNNDSGFYVVCSVAMSHRGLREILGYHQGRVLHGPVLRHAGERNADRESATHGVPMSLRP